MLVTSGCQFPVSRRLMRNASLLAGYNNFEPPGNWYLVTGT